MVNLSCGKPFSILLHIHRQKVYHTFTTPLPQKKGLPQQGLPHLYHTFTMKKVYHREGLPQQGLPQRLPQLLYGFVLPLSRKKKKVYHNICHQYHRHAKSIATCVEPLPQSASVLRPKRKRLVLVLSTAALSSWHNTICMTDDEE